METLGTITWKDGWNPMRLSAIAIPAPQSGLIPYIPPRTSANKITVNQVVVTKDGNMVASLSQSQSLSSWTHD